MKICFFTSVLNHHQYPFCSEMYKILGNNFSVVTTMELEESRKSLGYMDFANESPFCIKMHSDKNSYWEAYRLSQEADVLIAGVIPEEFISIRLKCNKLTYRYSERFYKQGFWRIVSPRALGFAYRDHFRYRRKSFYLLCASAYTATDASRIFSYPDKMFRWGYFPEFKEYEITDLLAKKESETLKLLWAGRFIRLKHPEYPLLVSQSLHKKGIPFSLEMIGTGELEGILISKTKEYGVSENVRFLGPLPPERVRERMEDSDIFLFTSNKQEGWGVVLNEAMNSGCAVVTNNSIGSVPFLIKSGQNGLIYRSGDINDLCNNVERLALNSELRQRLARQAYLTIKEEWNPKVAVSRLISQSKKILKNESLVLYQDGPMSLI